MKKDPPTVVCYHPLRTEVVCGCASGAVRVFDVIAASMIAEHRSACLFVLQLKQYTN